MNEFIERFKELNPKLFIKSKKNLPQKIKGIDRKEYYREYFKEYRKNNTQALNPHKYHVTKKRKFN